MHGRYPVTRLHILSEITQVVQAKQELEDRLARVRELSMKVAHRSSAAQVAFERQKGALEEERKTAVEEAEKKRAEAEEKIQRREPELEKELVQMMARAGEEARHREAEVEELMREHRELEEVLVRVKGHSFVSPTSLLPQNMMAGESREFAAAEMTGQVTEISVESQSIVHATEAIEQASCIAIETRAPMSTWSSWEVSAESHLKSPGVQEFWTQGSGHLAKRLAQLRSDTGRRTCASAGRNKGIGGGDIQEFREAFVASFCCNGGDYQDACFSHGCSCGGCFLCFFDQAPTRANPEAASANEEDGEVGD